MDVEVWNDNVHAYREKFRDRMIEIPAKGMIKMEYDEAHLFYGSFSSIKRDGNGVDMPEGYKMLRIVEPRVDYSKTAKPQTLLCQACRYLATDAKDFQAHSETHAGAVLVDEVAEAHANTLTPETPAPKKRGPKPKNQE